MACCTVVSWSFWACRLALTSSTTLAGALQAEHTTTTEGKGKEEEKGGVGDREGNRQSSMHRQLHMHDANAAVSGGFMTMSNQTQTQATIASRRDAQQRRKTKTR